MAETRSTKKDDLLGQWHTTLMYWGLPVAGLIVGGTLQIEPFVWPIALAWMGIGCVVNAAGCGRLHCYLTGPFFLLMAAVALFHALGVLPLGSEAWDWIGGVSLVGGVILYYLPERIWGRYVSKRSRQA